MTALSEIRIRSKDLGSPLAITHGAIGRPYTLNRWATRLHVAADVAAAFVYQMQSPPCLIPPARRNGRPGARRGRAPDADAARRTAETANRTKAEFLATMSHELRTPLNAIGGYIEILELDVHGTLTTEQRLDVTRIRRCQAHLMGLIGQVLTYAKLDAQAEQYETVPVSIDDLFTACDVLTAPLVREKRLDVQYVSSDQSLQAYADADKLRQIVLNLVSNAVKFTDSGGHVTVAAAAHGDSVVVRVTDTGCGIRADQIERVFQPFVQVDTTRDRRRQGTGLGLAISRLLARGMGGDLVVESIVGVGSTFTVSLPSVPGSAVMTS
jgi:signal transduction histidine kinase